MVSTNWPVTRNVRSAPSRCVQSGFFRQGRTIIRPCCFGDLATVLTHTQSVMARNVATRKSRHADGAPYEVTLPHIIIQHYHCHCCGHNWAPRNSPGPAPELVSAGLVPGPAPVAPRLRLVSGVAAAPAGTEYRAHAVRCPHCRARTRAAFSAEVAGSVSGARA